MQRRRWLEIVLILGLIAVFVKWQSSTPVSVSQVSPSPLKTPVGGASFNWTPTSRAPEFVSSDVIYRDVPSINQVALGMSFDEVTAILGPSHTMELEGGPVPEYYTFGSEQGKVGYLDHTLVYLDKNRRVIHIRGFRLEFKGKRVDGTRPESNGTARLLQTSINRQLPHFVISQSEAADGSLTFQIGQKPGQSVKE